ncbi:hypothetical protein BJY01DRAFT_260258 [Aspergillus pseudoustus]|uniref:Fungal-specific transcription factor domain-containing protein n=1 Tax=Aspergillus pseudoustus TaxID=1810923 RepID=A0ABR4IX21_9EURO
MYACTLCPASFQRREHFERHRRSHTKSKDFHCNLCQKDFARRDTLQRHMAIHGQATRRIQKVTSRAPRACVQCIRSKQRCIGPQPCDRCRRKGQECIMRSMTARHTASLPGVEVVQQIARPGNRSDPLPANTEGINTSATAQTPWRSPISAIYSLGASSSNMGDLLQPRMIPTIQDESLFSMAESETLSLSDPFLIWPWGEDFIVDMQSPASGPDGLLVDTTESTSLRYLQGHFLPSNEGSQTHESNNAYEEEYQDILASEDYGHIPKPCLASYEQACAHADSFTGISPTNVPDLDVIHVCVQAYFEHFHKAYPLLHQGTFRFQSDAYLLYWAVAAIGSQYSRLPNRSIIFSALLEIIQGVVLGKLASPLLLQNDLAMAQTMVLLNFSQLLRGTRQAIMQVQYQRNILVTMCRPLLSPGLLFEWRESFASDVGVSLRDWPRWIAIEAWKRVVYFTWLSESLQLIIFDLPSLMALEDMQLGLPCYEELWQALHFADWERLKNSAQGQPGTPSLLELIQAGPLRETRLRSASDLTLLIATFSVYVAERQATRQWPIYKHYWIAGHSADKPQQAPPSATSQEQHHSESIDSILASFQAKTSSCFQHQSVSASPVPHQTHKLALLTRLLRFIPYRTMYVASGWMADRTQSEGALQRIAHLLCAEDTQAESRQTLVHAARMFRIIRSQTTFDPHDSLILLMAVLYVWYYDRFAPTPTRVAAAEQAQRGQTELSSSSPTPNPAGRQILRIDQDIADFVIDRWITHGFGNNRAHLQIHITGIGVLDGERSPSRILREAIGILGGNKTWQQLSSAIKHALGQILAGSAPSFT